jgi:nucleoside-diphosphate-sugar epimerase
MVIEEFDPTHLVHLAARTDLSGTTVSEYAVNHIGTQAVIEGTRARAALQRIVFASTRLVCRIGYTPRDDEDYQATTPYGNSKIIAERAIRESELDIPWVIVRPTSIWGPWFEAPYRTFFDAIRQGRYVHPRGQRIRKSFGFVGNSVHQLDALLRCDSALVDGRTLYLADDSPIEVLEMANLIRREFDAPPVRGVPVGVLQAIAKGGDLAQRLGWDDPPLTSFRLHNLLSEMVYDVTPLREIAGPLPYDLETAIATTVRWMKKPGATQTAEL